MTERRERRRGGPKRRRPSYLVRQDEVSRLKTQMQALQKRLTQLQARPRSARAQILDGARANDSLRELIHGQQLAVAGARSLLAGIQVSHTSVIMFFLCCVS
jgi:uncharacterized protein YigA (DUF484 family)